MCGVDSLATSVSEILCVVCDFSHAGAQTVCIRAICDRFWENQAKEG